MGWVLTLMGVAAVVLVIAAAFVQLNHTPTRRAYVELWFSRLHDFKEKREQKYHHR